MSHFKSEIDIEYVKDCFIDTIDNGFKVKITSIG
jgi:hypothetical protein